MNQLISIIMPVYNAEEYLKRSIESIINQTYDNLEIILINDGSTDNSLNICKEYEKKDERIKIIDQENKGVSATRNRGINESTGDYIMFVDADDYIEKNMIEDMVAKLTEDDIELIITGIKMNYIKNGQTMTIEEYRLKDKTYTVTEMLDDILVDIDLICVCGPCCKLYKREILKNNNVKFTNEFTMGEDTWYNLDYIDACNGKIVTMSNIYYNYMRENPDSLFTKYYEDYIRITEKVYDKFLKLLKRKASNEAVIRYEKSYIFNLIYANSINFKYNTSHKKKMEDLNYSLNNNIVRNSIKNVKINNVKEKVFVLLIKYKFKYILYFYFKLKISWRSKR